MINASNIDLSPGSASYIKIMSHVNIHEKKWTKDT